MSARVLIVGCGNIAGGWDEDRDDHVVRTHAKAFLSHGGFTLAACVDPDDQRRARFAARWGVEATAADLTGFAGESFDVACLCTPSGLHAEQLDRLLAMDVRLVFAEKPLTDDLAASERLVGAYAQAGRPLAVNYLRRWDPSMAALKAEIAAGDWGRLLGASGLYTKGILANGSHMIDLLHFLLGPLEMVSADRVVVDWRAEDPTVEATLRHGEALVRLRAGDHRCFTVFELDLLFERGRVTVGDSGYRITRGRVVDYARFDGYRVLEPEPTAETGLGGAILAAAGNIHRHLAHGEPLPSTGATALETQEVCQALLRLASQGTSP